MQVIAILGRICLSLVFILSALQKILSWKTASYALLEHLTKIDTQVTHVAWLHTLFSTLIDYHQLFLATTTSLELAAGLLIFFGIQVRLGAGWLILFFLPATLYCHNFWAFQGAERDFQMAIFLKNISILGGLLLLFSFGTSSQAPKKQRAH